MVASSLGLGLLLASLAASSLPPECLQPSSAQPRPKPGDRTKVRQRRPKNILNKAQKYLPLSKIFVSQVMLGYLTAVTGSMNNRQVTLTLPSPSSFFVPSDTNTTDSNQYISCRVDV